MAGSHSCALRNGTAVKDIASALLVIILCPFQFTLLPVVAPGPRFAYSAKKQVSRAKFPCHGIHPAGLIKSPKVDSIMTALE